MRDLRAAPGDLVAYDVPPGSAWEGILERHVSSGVSFLPLDHRLTPGEKRRLLDLARPAMLVTEDDEIAFPDHDEADPERAWAVVATSGTGGEPKLAELPRAALGSAVAGSLDALGIGAEDLWVCCLTPAHVGGLLVLLRGVLAGAPLVIHERFDAARLLTDAPAGAHIALVPTMLARLVQEGKQLSHLGVLLVGGDALDPALGDAAAGLGARVVHTYGLTESCGGVAYDGTPFPGTQIRIEGGEVQIKGPTLMEGYRNDPRATARAFTTDGWLRTDDLGSIDDGGRLTVLGRADDAIRTGAETVWPDEVEAVLRTHPKVADVAVAGRPDPEWGQRVGAWVVPTAAADPPTLEDLRNHVSETLARHKAPRELILADAIPRTPSGKIRRRDLH